MSELTEHSGRDRHVVYWGLLEYERWVMHLAVTSEGLCYVGSDQAPFAALAHWMNKQLPDHRIVEDQFVIAPYRKAFIAYLAGELGSFNVKLKLYGTPFQQAVWQELQHIVYGKTETYSYIAERIGKPKAVRAVGSAIGANPVPIAVPCHRIIGKNGQLTGYRGGLDMKRRLLELEQNERNE